MRKFRFAIIALAAGAAAPLLAAGIEIDPNGGRAAASSSPAQTLAALLGYPGGEQGSGVDPNG